MGEPVTSKAENLEASARAYSPGFLRNGLRLSLRFGLRTGAVLGLLAAVLLAGASVTEAALSPAPPVPPVALPRGKAPTNLPNPSMRMGMRTNPAVAAPAGPRSSLTNAAVVARMAARTNVAAGTNVAPAKSGTGLADTLQRTQLSQTVETVLGLGLLLLAGLLIYLAKAKPAPLPAWLKWGCRGVGGFLVLGSLLQLAGGGLLLWQVLHAPANAPAAQQNALAALLGQLTGTALLLALGIWLFRVSNKKAGASALVAVAAASTPSRANLKLPKGARRNAQVCNVLQSGADARQLWHFDARSGGFVLNRQQTSLPGESLPGGLISKSWGTLFAHKLNVAWLPSEQVFLRVAQFPASDLTETLSMVELQLEKLSPMPVAQVVWTIDVLPHPKGNMQTVVVMMAARNAVEEFLGQLEGQGYLADRLELPLLDQMQALPHKADGAMIFPQAAGGSNSALVAWWYDGVLQNLDLLTLPASQPAEGLKEQLTQMAWAGEMEGWLTSTPRWHLVADQATAAVWEPALRAGLDQPMEVMAPLPAAELAALTARRAALSDPRANMLPVEFATRYQAQFWDRIWLHGLMALGGVYLIGVAIYGIALGVLSYSTTSVEDKVWDYSGSYSNAVQLKAKYQILKDRDDLKFAALDCWNYVAKLMPTELTLDTMNFADGKKLTLSGTVPGDQTTLVNDFETAMRKAKDAKGEPFFDPLGGDHFTLHMVPGGAASWTFTLELKRSEVTQ
jgi:hypothetical protein